MMLKVNIWKLYLKMTMMTKIVFIEADGKEKEIDAQNGLSLLEVAHNNGISLEGACEGSLACSTCHIILEKKFFEKPIDGCIFIQPETRNKKNVIAVKGKILDRIKDLDEIPSPYLTGMLDLRSQNLETMVILMLSGLKCI